MDLTNILKTIRENIDDGNLAIKLGEKISQQIKNDFVDKSEYDLLQKQTEKITDYEEISKQANNWQIIKQTFEVETPENLIAKTKNLSKEEMEKLTKDFEEKEKMNKQDYETKLNNTNLELENFKNNYKREKMLNIAKELNIIDDFQELTILAFKDKHIIKDEKIYAKDNLDLPLNKEGKPLTEIEAYKDFISTKEVWQKASNITGAGSNNGKGNDNNLPQFWQDRFQKIEKKE